MNLLIFGLLQSGGVYVPPDVPDNALLFNGVPLKFNGNFLVYAA